MKTPIELSPEQVELLHEIFSTPGFALGPKHWVAAASLKEKIDAYRALSELPPHV